MRLCPATRSKCAQALTRSRCNPVEPEQHHAVFERAVAGDHPVSADGVGSDRESARSRERREECHDRDFTIAGPGAPPLTGCQPINLYGVRVDNSGSAVIVGNHITEIRDNPPAALGGCQSGVGLLVGRNFEAQSGSALVVHNVFDNYQKGAIVVDGIIAGTSSWAEVAYNLIYGDGPTPAIAQNGIQVSRNAVANVHHNRVTNNNYSLPGTTSAGLLMFDEKPNGTIVSKNASAYNDEGVDLLGLIGTEVSFNWLLQNDVDGIWSGDHPFPPLFRPASDNKIKYNLSQDNAEHDCHDDTVGTNTAGTTNFWFKNIGATENKPGLCKGSGSHW